MKETMASTVDPGIICYQHCGRKIFTFKLPESCIACDCTLSGAVLPFRLPYPFVKASQYPCAIVLRPTHGDFLNDYFNHMDLHIGVTTSTGAIVEFDRCGLQWHSTTSTTNNTNNNNHQLHRDKGTTLNSMTSSNGRDNKSKWGQSLLVEQLSEEWMEHWDVVLEEICQQSRWNPETYREDSHNCYSFVLAFLKQLGYGTLSQLSHNKTQFCEKFIVPRTTAAGKYISLYRKIRDHGFYIHPTTAVATTTPIVAD